MTSDLMEEHPTKPGYWKIYGRSDDQIMHSTGEKVNIFWSPLTERCKFKIFHFSQTNPGPLGQ